MDASIAEGIVQFLLGCIALFAGRNIFWLFIALAGFLIGYEVTGIWLASSSLLVQLAIAFAAGLLGAVLAIIFERVAFALAGFYAAAYVAVILAGTAGIAADHTAIALVAGLAGAVVSALLMDWAIIVFSALVGAAAIASVLPVTPMIEIALTIVLAAIGIAVQRAVFVKSGPT